LEGTSRPSGDRASTTSGYNSLVDPDTMCGHDPRTGVDQKLRVTQPRRPRQRRVDIQRRQVRKIKLGRPP